MAKANRKGKGVKGQQKAKPRGAGFDKHPENINKEGGPPKTHWWSELYKEELERDSQKRKGLKKKVSVVRATVEEAEKGSIAHIKEIGDRVQGKAPQGVGYFDDDGNFQEQSLVVKFIEPKGGRS